MVANNGRVSGGRRAEILLCFAEMVADRGYDQVSLRDIADALGMSKGTILHHFRSKDRMLEHLHHGYMIRRLGEAYLILDRLDSPTEKLSGLIYQLILAQRDDRAATVAFTREIQRCTTEDIMQQVRALRREYSDLMRNVILQGIRDGNFAPVNADLVTLQVFGMCNWLWTWYRSDGRLTADQISAGFTQTLLQGLARNESNDAPFFADVYRIVQDAVRDFTPSSTESPI